MCTRYTSMISNKFLSFLWRFGTVLIDEPMSNHTTYKTGGPADCFFIPKDASCLGEVRAFAQKEGLPFVVIGGGSNILVSDKGIRGVIVCISGQKEDGIMIVEEDDRNVIAFAHAPVNKDIFVKWAARRGFSGMEFMTGIPGSIGGGIAMNAGTNMGWFSDILTRVRIIDKSGTLREVNITPEMNAYRKMRFDEGTIILGGYFTLNKSENPEIIQTRIEEILREREAKHPIEFPSAGSVFKNPDGHAAWKLIDDAGLRGYAIGGAMISEKHTNFIINTGKATSADIYALMCHVQRTVFQQFGVHLDPEIKMIGEF